jgi:simple sugar transport system ATP-binding protein
VIFGQRERAVAQRAIEELRIRCDGPGDTLDRLSGGNQQKVVIGRWQAAPCRIFLADEPFQGVDIGSRRDLIDAIRSRQGDAATLIATKRCRGGDRGRRSYCRDEQSHNRRRA